MVSRGGHDRPTPELSAGAGLQLQVKERAWVGCTSEAKPRARARRGSGSIAALGLLHALIHRSAWRDCMESPQVRARRLVMRRIMAAYTNASPLAHNLS